MQRPVEERFWSKVDKSGECWIWTGAKMRAGYGRFRESGRTVNAHRWAYESMYGPLPEGMFACHHCDNPSCVRPEHLFAGTAGDNARDMIAKGRGREYPKKERSLGLMETDYTAWRLQVLENFRQHEEAFRQQFNARRRSRR